MTCLENIIDISTMFIVLVTIQTIKAEEIEVKRGERVHTLTPTPRRRSDPEFMKWDSEINAILDDDYEGGEYTGNEFVRPYFGFPRISRAGSRLYSKLGEGSQETIKRGGPGGGAGMWLDHVWIVCKSEVQPKSIFKFLNHQMLHAHATHKVDYSHRKPS